jgi:sirohydrochlorin cobaltochelatase
VEIETAMKPAEPKTGVMICGHGSRDPEAVAEFARAATGLKALLPVNDIEFGYLEFARPVIQDGFEALARRGAKRILALPVMLFAASHVKNDLPSEVNRFAAIHPGIDMRFGRELSIEPKLLNAAADRIAEAERTSQHDVPRSETLLVVVGRGTTDPDANSNISKLARMLWEGMGFGWAEVAFSGTASPLVEPGLRRAAMLGFKRIIVFPYFLFTGVLVKRIYAAADKVAADHPDIEFIKASYLSDHPLVLECLAERVAEIGDIEPAMNCRLCKYREQIVGHEDAVGTPQQGHHHHVQGIGTDADHHHHHDHDHAHDHDHRGHGHHPSRRDPSGRSSR